MGQFIPGVITHSRIPTESHVRVSASLGVYFPTYAIEDLAVSPVGIYHLEGPALLAGISTEADMKMCHGGQCDSLCTRTVPQFQNFPISKRKEKIKVLISRKGSGTTPPKP